MEKFLTRLSKPVKVAKEKELRVPFPGFEAVFGCPLASEPVAAAIVNDQNLLSTLTIKEPHQRVHSAVGLYVDAILHWINSNDVTPDLWIVFVIPEVFKHCRPLQARLRLDDAEVPFSITAKQARLYCQAPSLFEEDMVPMAAFEYEPDFHSQIKFRLLKDRVVTQLLREETTHLLLDYNFDSSKPSEQTQANDLSWRFSTAIYYKVHGAPWKLANLRSGVCYLGLVFKKAQGNDERAACCAAQMFLDSGDGVVFRGAVGPWYNPKRRQFHLTTEAASELCALAVNAYEEDFKRRPNELFIHGRSGFNDEEWAGFLEGAKGVGHVGAVRIKDAAKLRLYANGLLTPLRGLAWQSGERSAALLTHGFVPRTQTYAGSEVPVPLGVDVLRGDSCLQTVLSDVLSLTKLNYNSCNFGDGSPVTLRFADNIGEILTAGKQQHIPPLPFKHYI
ncbi:MAG: hypothetical protein ACK4XJ_11210 [Fimbriimonadaceae bacterium]